MVLVAAQICDEKKATDTRILELDPADSGFTDFFLITSGTNTRQTGAIADEIELRLKREFGVYARSVEGRRSGEWILLDYFDFVVHIFTEQTREFYDIERLRKSARSVDTAELSAALRRKTQAAREHTPAKKTALKKAPAKKAPAKKAPAKKAPAKKAPAKKAAAQNAPAKTAPAKKAPANPAPPNKPPPKNPPPNNAPAKKALAKSAKKVPAKKAPAKSVQDLSPRALPGSPAPVRQLPPPASKQ